MASIVSEPDQEKAAQKNIKSGNVWLNPNGPQLAKMAELLEQNKLKVMIGHGFPLSEEGSEKPMPLAKVIMRREIK
ncbi:hypothetical protein [Paenibacillus sp. DMB20]|uniref:hypothetical protein n=1 Tax=Paenibacillus sp. DMB20 TaxID=1642570 RepID=UPI000627A1AB|nr:hypothetical protein [Paenibacillus sp. DMB20]KKO54818.1 hypothetical protein XI25_04905 [Paenibacillus sp. DMB20]